MSGNKSLRPCPCQIPHLAKNKREDSAWLWDDVKGFVMAVVMHFSWWVSSSGRDLAGAWGCLTQPHGGSGNAHLPPRVGAEEGKEPGCRDGSGQVKTTPTLRRAVNICPYPQAISIFVPSHTLTDSEEGSEGGEVRRSQPGAAGGLKEEEEEVLRNQWLLFFRSA